MNWPLEQNLRNKSWKVSQANFRIWGGFLQMTEWELLQSSTPQGRTPETLQNKKSENWRNHDTPLRRGRMHCHAPENCRGDPSTEAWLLRASPLSAAQPEIERLILARQAQTFATCGWFLKKGVKALIPQKTSDSSKLASWRNEVSKNIERDQSCRVYDFLLFSCVWPHTNLALGM